MRILPVSLPASCSAAVACGSATADCRGDLVKSEQNLNRTRGDLQQAATATPPVRCAAYRKHVASLTEVRSVFARCDTGANKAAQCGADRYGARGIDQADAGVLRRSSVSPAGTARPRRSAARRDDDQQRQRRAEPPVVAEAVAARAHHQRVALMADRREEVAARADRDRHQERVGPCSRARGEGSPRSAPSPAPSRHC